MWNMLTPHQATRVTRKIIEARKHMNVIGNWSNVVTGDKFSIKKAYQLVRGDPVKIPWKSLACSNPAVPRANFISWMALWSKPRKKEIVNNEVLPMSRTG